MTWNQVKHYLWPSVPDCYRKEFTDDTNTINIFRAKITSKMFMVFATVRMIYAILFEGTAALVVPRVYYLYVCALMFTVMTAFSTVFGRLEKNISEKEAIIRVVSVVFITCMLAWGASVSLLDQLRYGQVNVYVVAVMSIAIFPLCEPVKLMCMYGFVHVVFLSSLPFFQHSPSILSGHVINSTIFVVLSWVISMIIYGHHRDLFLSRKRIDEQNHELIAMNEELDRLSNLDGLTGVYNRRKFDEVLRTEWDRCGQQMVPLSLIMVDIDLFKQFNDHYGHIEGDQCICQVADALQQCARTTTDLVARYGGDEFVLLLPNVSNTDALAIAERVRQKVEDLNTPHAASSVAPYVTVSLGVQTIQPTSQCRVEDILSGADQALFAAKFNERNRVERAGT